jgi:serine/threonine-protein kinase
VAIKLLAEGYAADERAVRRFMREARAAARLSGHPHVITIYDVGHAEGRPYLVMQHLAGGTVADALRVGAAPIEDALRWIREAGQALDHAHDHGVLHRDVKPANMLLSRDRVLHLADFGIARLAAEHAITSVGEMLGTVAYMSPEQTRGRAATAASDRYALAVAAFELLVGRRPFDAEHFTALARAHQDEPPPSASAYNDKLPPTVDRVLARGLAKHPGDRWSSAGAFASALERAVRAGRRPSPPALVLGPSRWPDGRSRGVADRRRRVADQRRRPRAAAIAALAVPALVVGALVGAGHSGGARNADAAARAPAPQLPAARATHRSNTNPNPNANLPAKAIHSAPPVAKPATVATVAASLPSPSADQLEAHGHQLMVDGAYSTAIPVLHQAVSSAAPGSLTYAYALYDLGRSLRLAGEPGAAVPVLEQRLKIPNQSGVVRQELRLALAAANPPGPAGASPTAAPGAPGLGHRDRAFTRQNRGEGSFRLRTRSDHGEHRARP